MTTAHEMARGLRTIDKKFKNAKDLQTDSINDMYEIFLAAEKDRNKITESEFSRYAVLYKAPEKIYKQDIDPEFKYYADLAKEFSLRVNIFKPIEIVDNRDRSKVKLTLPPVFNEFASLEKEHAKAPMTFTNIMLRASDTIHKAYTDQATRYLIGTVIQQQIEDGSYKANHELYHKLNEDFMRSEYYSGNHGTRHNDLTEPSASASALEWEPD